MSRFTESRFKLKRRKLTSKPPLLDKDPNLSRLRSTNFLVKARIHLSSSWRPNLQHRLSEEVVSQSSKDLKNGLSSNLKEFQLYPRIRKNICLQILNLSWCTHTCQGSLATAISVKNSEFTRTQSICTTNNKGADRSIRWSDAFNPNCWPRVMKPPIIQIF